MDRVSGRIARAKTMFIGGAVTLTAPTTGPLAALTTYNSEGLTFCGHICGSLWSLFF